jgi:SAM-dependent methyltransferase
MTTNRYETPGLMNHRVSRVNEGKNMNDQDDQFASGIRFRLTGPARDAAEVQARHTANRQGWNEGAAHYTAQLEETIAFLRAGSSNLHPVERENLARYGDLRAWCHTAIHLQCASGRDTLSLWNEGVTQVIGVDIADVHIANARQISAALDIRARWYRCDLLETPHELDGTADLVYTGRGALCWLHDLDGWAAVIYRLLKPGGIAHIFDDHPITWLFDPDATTLAPSGLNYFSHSESSQGWPETYIGSVGKPIEQHATKFERLWPLSAIMQALRNAGLTLEFFGEHTEPYWDSFPNLQPELRGYIPMTFSLVVRRLLEHP